MYASTVSQAVLTKQSLVSMLSGNNLTYAIVAENNPGEHTFALPDAWTNTRPLTAVYYFNAVSNQFDNVKILAKGELKTKLLFKINAISEKAKQSIEKLGGTIEVVK